MIFLEDPIWYSPHRFILHANRLNNSLSTEEKNTKEFRKVVEAVAVAQMLIGLIAREKKEYWMQLVDDKHGTPDIKTIRYADEQSGNFDELEQVDVEVVQYEMHSAMSIPEFIVKTKFSNKKSYDNNTVILCHVGGSVKSVLPDTEKIKEQMKRVRSSCQVILLAGVDENASRLKLIELLPRVGVLIEFDLNEELNRRDYLGVINFKRGTQRPPEYFPGKIHYPFEKLGYIPNKYGTYKCIQG